MTPHPVAVAAVQSTWRRPFVLLLLGLALALSALLPASTLGATGAAALASAANAERSDAGVAPASSLPALNTIAGERSDEMAAERSMTHDLDYVSERLEDMGVCWSSIGEIIATSGQGSAAGFVGQWMNSPPHRAIMLNAKYTRLGGAWTPAGDGNSYAVMLFIKPCGSTTVVPPAPSIGHMTFGPGSHTGYHFDGSTVVATRTATLGSWSGANVGARQRINGKVYLKVNDGIWAGYWVPETYRSYLPGYFGRVLYETPVRLVFAAGHHVALKYYSSGNAYATLGATLSARSGANATQHAIINGSPHFYIANGIWAGYWMPDKAGVWPAP